MAIPYGKPFRHCGYKGDLESFNLACESGKVKPMGVPRKGRPILTRDFTWLNLEGKILFWVEENEEMGIPALGNSMSRGQGYWLVFGVKQGDNHLGQV